MGISVVIPAYNAERWLGRAIDSVLLQTVRPSEIIVVDDGSTDSTKQVANQYRASIHYIRQENAGVSAARNRAILEARGKYVAFLDADDEWLPHKLAVQECLFERHAELMWCAGRPAYVRHDGWDPAPLSRTLARVLDSSSCVSFFAAARAGLPMQTSGVVIRRDVLEEVGMFDSSLKTSEDRDLWWRIAMKYPMIGYESRVCYRWHLCTPGSLTKSAGSRESVVLNLCGNRRRAEAYGPDVCAMFDGYARTLVKDYLLRAATGHIHLTEETAAEAMAVFRIGVWRRAFLAGLGMLPKPMAWKIGKVLSL